ncbi:MAG TPA: alpha-amylase family glycosyl hydrolase [Ferruginibacter sp.]|nr:alpha-amylase family glycosyl hydrolase [Ferruginibacter sp.]
MNNSTQPFFKRAQWIQHTNIYEVNLRQFSVEGTFNAFAKALPRLAAMGVETLWIMPIHPIGKVNRKGTLGSYYSISNFMAVNPEFGTADDFKNLIELAHSSGMKVIMDWIANHAAWDNVWTKDHPEYFVRDEEGNFKPPYDWTDVIQIDHTNATQQDAMINAMKYWVTNFDIDGFRADLAHLTPLEFWQKARAVIEPLKDNLFWLAESEEINYHQVFDATFTWEWMHSTEDFYKHNHNINSLYTVLEKYNHNFPKDAYRMYFTSNHDENSWNGTEYEKYAEMALPLAVFSCTWNGIPMIYSGQELPNLKRLKFFDKDEIEWNGENKLHDFYKTLFSLHKKNNALSACDTSVKTFIIKTGAPEKIMAYLRKAPNAEVLVLLNLSDEETGFILHDELIDGDFTDVFDNIIKKIITGSFIRLNAWGYKVFERSW